jgi:REP element-mobilizing transposase RayT
MKYDPDRNHRRSIRLKEYNYSQVGAYFVTICTQNRELLLDDVGIRLMVQKWWDALPEKFPDIRTDQFIIMPNHIHGIIFIVSVGADQRVCLITGNHIGLPLQTKPTLGRIVQWFKTMTTNDYIKAVRMNNVEPFPGKLWQRNYYEHIIRDETDLNSIRQYIIDNPSKWEEDEDNPKNLARVARGQALASRK